MPVATASLWLKTAAAAAMIGLGLMVAVAAWPPLSGPALWLTDLLDWPLDGAQTFASTETRVMMALAGGVMAGWGAMVWQVASHVLPADPALARKSLLPSILLWFAIDSMFSVIAGVPLNALFNVGILAVFLWPLARIERAGARAA